MTVALTFLVLTLILPASMWSLCIESVNTHPQTSIDDFARPPPLTGFSAWVRRSHRAHLNLIEAAMPFCAAVLLTHMLDVSTWVTVWAAAGFFWLRMMHAAGMVSRLTRSPVRPILFTLSWLCTLAICVQLLIEAPAT